MYSIKCSNLFILICLHSSHNRVLFTLKVTERRKPKKRESSSSSRQQYVCVCLCVYAVALIIVAVIVVSRSLSNRQSRLCFLFCCVYCFRAYVKVNVYLCVCVFVSKNYPVFRLLCCCPIQVDFHTLLPLDNFQYNVIIILIIIARQLVLFKLLRQRCYCLFFLFFTIFFLFYLLN